MADEPIRLSYAQRITLACIAGAAAPEADFDTAEDRHTLARLEMLRLVEQRGGFVWVTELGKTEAAKLEAMP